uniref:Neur_chan_LBD domain-containing protein n=1 Tax=Globodera pallida TaxID=36090 RepID=A0A183BZY8_GLOPA
MKILIVFYGIISICFSMENVSLRDRLQRNIKKLPSSVENGPMKVWTGIYIESLGNFRATEMSFDVDLYLYLSWNDPSLRHSEPDFVMLNDPKIRQSIWLPDLYFPNAHSSRFHEVIAPNLNLFISPNGTVAYSTRITLSVACNLELSLYPIDGQMCRIEMLSYAYVERQLLIRWFDIVDPTRHNPNIQLPEFRISNITGGYCNGSYKYAIMEHAYRTDNFSCLVALIHLNRQIGYHVVQTYIPTGLIVTISAVPARVTLSFTTMLSLSTLGNGLRFGLPQVAYAKAIDFCLLEFAAVNSYMRESDKFERFASYIGKKNSTFVKELSRNLSIKMPKIPRKITEQRQNWEINVKQQNEAAPMAEDEKSLGERTLSQCSAIEEIPTDFEGKAKNWSSAATVGESNELTVPMLDTSAAHRPPHSRINFNTARHNKFRPSLRPDRADIINAHLREHRDLDGNPLITNHFLRQSIHFSRKGLQIDRCSRWIFPLGFALWNVCYWTYYLWYIQ